MSSQTVEAQNDHGKIAVEVGGGAGGMARARSTGHVSCVTKHELMSPPDMRLSRSGILRDGMRR